MKTRIILLAVLATFTFAASAATITRSDTLDALNTTTAWVGGVVPTTADTATWDASSTLDNTLGALQTWGGLDISAAGGAVAITPSANLILDNSTDANTVFNVGANNFTWSGNSQFHINGAAGSTSSTATGATFSGSSVVTLGGTGTKNWSTNATSNGVTNVTFTGTLALRGATIPAVGVLPTNWLAFGGGGGAASDAGTTVQTGSFALDLGDASSCGALILTQGWSGQYLKLNSLSGTGSIRSDWGTSTGTQTRGIELDQAGDTVMSGSILVHNGSNQRRNVSFVKKGAGTLTLTGGLGSQATAAGAVASLNFDIRGGTLQWGDGMTNITYVNAANWDAASTFVIGGTGTFRIAASGGFNFNRKITGGTGTFEVTSGDVAASADNSLFEGNTVVAGGSLRLGPSLGSGTVTVKENAGISAGLPAANGTSAVASLVLEASTQSTFRLGTTNDQITVTDDGGLTVPPAGGFHTINLSGRPTAGGTITLIDYSGTALGAGEFNRFVLGTTEGAATFELVNNTANTSIDLSITLEDQVWKGTSDGNWDLATSNWELASMSGVPTIFDTDHPALFDDNAYLYAVTVHEDGVSPLAVTIDNSINDYTFTGGAIAGTGALLKKGTATATLAQPSSYTGGTTVDAGSLVFTGATNTSSGGITVNAGKVQIGAGGTTGDIGSGAVVVAEGGTIEFNRSNAIPGTPDLNYKTDAKMRNVSGAGDIVLDGGLMLFNYPGGGVEFSAAGTWNNFSGNLTVKGGSEFQTIRNGATAMGAGDVILGDMASSGSLSQIEGNWTWTNDIVLAGSDNKILNRAGGSDRRLKLQGVISGSGGLTFEDATGGMTSLNHGFILTNTNTLDGTLTIAAGTPVRVGGVPGNVDASNPGVVADAFGTLGDATVVNNGTLTFTRTDAHSVANSISGSGALRIGVPAAANLGDTSTQVVTYTGTASHTGATTVNNGTLIVASGASVGGSGVTVAAGATLGGAGMVAAPLTAAGTVAPGVGGIGTLLVTTGDGVVTGTLAIEVDGANADKLSVAGSLDLTGSTLTVTKTGAGFTADSYVIAECGVTLTGLPTPPNGYLVEAAGNQVVLRKAAVDDFTSWIEGFTFAPGADLTQTGDPDGDGMTNFEEYAFGLKPNDGASVNPILVPLSRTAGTFTYSRRDNALTGLTYKVWTSPDLVVWTEDAGAIQDDSAGPDGQGVEPVVVTLSGAKPPAADRLFVRVSVENPAVP